MQQNLCDLEPVYPYPAPTYEEPHWFTGKLKIRCSECHKVAYPTKDIAKYRAEQISERTPMRHYYDGHCGHWHVSKIKPRKRR